MWMCSLRQVHSLSLIPQHSFSEPSQCTVENRERRKEGGGRGWREGENGKLRRRNGGARQPWQLHINQ